MTNHLQVVEETGVPGENYLLTPSHKQQSQMPRARYEMRRDLKQLTVSGNALDLTAIRAGPQW